MTAGKWIIIVVVGAAILAIFVWRDLEGQKEQKVRVAAQQVAAESRQNLVAAGQIYYRALSLYDSLHELDIRRGEKFRSWFGRLPNSWRTQESYYLHGAMNSLATAVFKDSANLSRLRLLPTEMPELPPIKDDELDAAAKALHIVNFIESYRQEWERLKHPFDSAYDAGWPRPNR
jgi:hypothetical protein